MKQCVQCGGKKFVATQVPVSRLLAGATFTAQVAGRRCAACGAQYAGQAALEEFDRRVARAVAAAGVATGEALRFMRKVVGVSAKEFADLLGVTPETLSRWEHGRRGMDPTALRILRAATLDECEGRTTTLDELRATQATTRLGKRVAFGKIVA